MIFKKKKASSKKKAVTSKAPEVIDSSISINEYKSKRTDTKETSISINVTIDGVLTKDQLIELVTSALREQE